MPRYFFNVYDGYTRPDTEGIELADFDQARRHAVAFAGRLLDDEASRMGLSEDWHMEVVDETGLLLFRLDFIVTASPAVSGGSRKPL